MDRLAVRREDGVQDPGIHPSRSVAFARLGPAVLLAAGTGADAVGSAAGQPILWVAAAYLLTAGILAGLAAGGMLLFRRLDPAVRSNPPSHRTTWPLVGYALGIALFALARWVRGEAEIPPDPPILAAEVVASVAVIAAARSLGRQERSGRRANPD